MCVYYIVYSLIRLRKATDANCPNKHFVSPHSWPDCHHSFQPQAPSLLWVEHVTFTGVDCTGEGQSELRISLFLHFSDHLAQIQPAAPPNQKAKAAPICSPPLQPIFLVPSTVNIEKSLFPSSLQQPLT